MPEADVAARQQARITLVRDAANAKRVGMSAMEWKEEMLASEYGELLGPRELESIWRLIWGVGCSGMEGAI